MIRAYRALQYGPPRDGRALLVIVTGLIVLNLHPLIAALWCVAVPVLLWTLAPLERPHEAIEPERNP